MCALVCLSGCLIVKIGIAAKVKCDKVCDSQQRKTRTNEVKSKELLFIVKNASCLLHGLS